ncbi:MAG: hypothetical protein HYV36_00820, partial [Lentisphaerae bacterium]|nr:hypothetical protein [Lentisphaerota bacterium]
MKQLRNDGIIGGRTVLGRLALAGILLFGGLAATALAHDADGDQMPDSYELFYGLDPSKANDANKDDDGDQLQNLAESVLWTDPYAWDTDRDQ